MQYFSVSEFDSPETRREFVVIGDGEGVESSVCSPGKQLLDVVTPVVGQRRVGVQLDGKHTDSYRREYKKRPDSGLISPDR